MGTITEYGDLDAVVPETELSADAAGVVLKMEKGGVEADIIISLTEPEDIGPYWTSKVLPPGVASWRLPRSGVRIGDKIEDWKVVRIRLYQYA